MFDIMELTYFIKGSFKHWHWRAVWTLAWFYIRQDYRTRQNNENRIGEGIGHMPKDRRFMGYACTCRSIWNIFLGERLWMTYWGFHEFPSATCALRNRQIVSIEWVYTEGTFFMKPTEGVIWTATLIYHFKDIKLSRSSRQ